MRFKLKLLNSSYLEAFAAPIICIGATVLSLPSQVQAADAAKGGSVLEEIVVTAQKRVQNAQEVGISITAMSGDQLKSLGVKGTEGMTMVPGLYISSFNSQTTTTLSIRGVSQNDFADHNEPPVALYVDGAYNSFIGGAGMNMFDVERVEVLRGPQGTLFGRNATGGLMHIITKKPTKDFEGYAELNMGERGLMDFEGAVGGPLSDKVRARVSVSTTHNNGFVHNTLGGGDLQGANNYSGRLQVEFLPSDKVDLLVNIHGGRDNVKNSIAYDTKRAMSNPNDPAGLVFTPTSDAQYANYCLQKFGSVITDSVTNCAGVADPAPNNPYVTAVDNPGQMTRDTYGATVTAKVQFSDSISLTSITDYLKLKRDATEDTDGTQLRLFNFYGNVDSNQFSEEVRLQGEVNRLHWVTGLYYIQINHHIVTGIDAVPDIFTLANAAPGALFPFYTTNTVHQTTKSWSVFAQTDYKLTDNLSVTVGGRWTKDKKKIDIFTDCSQDIFDFACAIVASPDVVQGTGFNSITNPELNNESNGDYSAKFELDYHPVTNVMVYGSITRGLKSGGFNAAAIADIPASAEPYKPEVLLSYEGGFKSEIFGGRAQLNSSAFYYDYHNYQAFTLTGLTPTVFNTNATVKGFEAELRASPFSGLEVMGGVAYLDAIAHDVPSNLLPGSVNLGDQHMPQSPKWSFDGLARYSWPAFNGVVALQGDFNYVGRRFFNTVNHPALQNGAYAVFNSRLTYSSGDDRWEAAIWVKNITNTEYASTGFDLSGTNGTVTRTISPPRWFGVTLTLHWQ